MNHRIFSTLVVAPLLLPLAGCTGNVDVPVAPDADASELAAAITIETTSHADGSLPAHTTAVARFIRTRVGPVDVATLRSLGAASDLPPIGACAVVSTPASGTQSVELVDVGGVSIEAAGHAFALAARSVPDVTDLVSGIVYSTRTYGDDALVAGPVSIRVAGTDAIGPVRVDVANLEAPTDVTFDGTAADGLGPVVLSGASAVHVTWSAPVVPTGDLVTFEIVSAGEALACTFADDGIATLPAPLFASGRGTIVVHRVRREAIVARGIDDGEARLDLARVYDFVAP